MRHYDMYDYYDYGSSHAETLVMGIVMIVTIVLLVWAIFSLGSYILKGIGMYTIAKRLGIEYAWLAFVPFARTYLHGELSGKILLKKRSIQNPGIWLLALPFLYSAIYSLFYAVIWFMGFGTLMKVGTYNYAPYNLDINTGSIMGIIVVSLIFMIFALAYAAFYKALEVLVNHQILERFTSKNMSVVHAVLCTVIPMYESICLFAMRNRLFNPGMEPPAPTPFMQSPPPGSYHDNYGQNGDAFSTYGTQSHQNGDSFNNYGAQSHQSGDSFNNYGTQSPQSGSGFSNYGAQPSQSENGFSNYGAQSSQSENGFSNYGTQSPQSETGYNNYGMQSPRTDTGSPVNFILPGNDTASAQPDGSAADAEPAATAASLDDKDTKPKDIELKDTEPKGTEPKDTGQNL